MKIINNSDDFSSYTKEQHIENLKQLAGLTKNAIDFGAGTGGVEQIMTIAIRTASESGLSNEDIATYSQKSILDIQAQLQSKQ